MKENTHSKFILFIIELLIVILFFSFSSIVCVQLFVKGSNNSNLASDKSNALIIGESIMEKMKQYSGESLVDYLANGEAIDNSHIKIYYNDDWELSIDEDIVVEVKVEKKNLNYYESSVSITKDNQQLIYLETMSGGYHYAEN